MSHPSIVPQGGRARMNRQRRRGGVRIGKSGIGLLACYGRKRHGGLQARYAAEPTARRIVIVITE